MFIKNFRIQRSNFHSAYVKYTNKITNNAHEIGNFTRSKNLTLSNLKSSPSVIEFIKILYEQRAIICTSNFHIVPFVSV